MPGEGTSIILGSPGEYKAEHNEGGPHSVYVKASLWSEGAERRSGQSRLVEQIADRIA